MMSLTPIRKTYDEIHDALHLTRMCMLRSIEFQLFFDLGYIFLLMFIGNIFLQYAVNFFDHVLLQLRIGSTLAHIPFLSFIDLHTSFVLFALFLLFALFYLVETNTMIIITSSYYRNKAISSFRAFIRACIKTPHVLLVRIIELRMHFYVLIGSYLLWNVISQSFPRASTFTHWGGTILLLYGFIVACAILFHSSMSAFVVCVDKNESPFDFINRITVLTYKKYLRAAFVYYLFFFLIALLWIFFFSAITKIMIMISHAHPSIVSHVLTLFISTTIMSIFIFFSITKTLRMSILTIIYHDERHVQKRITPITLPARVHQPRRLFTVLIIVAIIACGVSIISFSTYAKTDLLVSHTEKFIHEHQKPTVPHIPKTSDDLADRLFSKDHTTIDMIENMLFSYIAILLKK